MMKSGKLKRKTMWDKSEGAVKSMFRRVSNSKLPIKIRWKNETKNTSFLFLLNLLCHCCKEITFQY